MVIIWPSFISGTPLWCSPTTSQSLLKAGDPEEPGNVSVEYWRKRSASVGAINNSLSRTPYFLGPPSGYWIMLMSCPTRILPGLGISPRNLNCSKTPPLRNGAWRDADHRKVEFFTGVEEAGRVERKNRPGGEHSIDFLVAELNTAILAFVRARENVVIRDDQAGSNQESGCKPFHFAVPAIQLDDPANRNPSQAGWFVGRRLIEVKRWAYRGAP